MSVIQHLLRALALLASRHPVGAAVHVAKAQQLLAQRPTPALPRRRPRHSPQPFTMFDSIEPEAIPRNAVAVAGYVGGRWPTFKELLTRFPRARHLSIAVNHREDASCLDIERGDATPQEAPEWVKRQHARGVKMPKLYASVSQMPAVLAELGNAGIRRSSVKLWTAHYTGHAHLCDSRCGFGFHDHADATQWVDHGPHGENYDVSLCAAGFLG